LFQDLFSTARIASKRLEKICLAAIAVIACPLLTRTGVGIANGKAFTSKTPLGEEGFREIETCL